MNAEDLWEVAQILHTKNGKPKNESKKCCSARHCSNKEKLTINPGVLSAGRSKRRGQNMLEPVEHQTRQEEVSQSARYHRWNAVTLHTLVRVVLPRTGYLDERSDANGLPASCHRWTAITLEALHTTGHTVERSNAWETKSKVMRWRIVWYHANCNVS